MEMPPKHGSPEPRPQTLPSYWNWLLKACFLCLYHRWPLPTALKEQRLVNLSKVKVSETLIHRETKYYVGNPGHPFQSDFSLRSEY